MELTEELGRKVKRIREIHKLPKNPDERYYRALKQKAFIYAEISSYLTLSLQYRVITQGILVSSPKKYLVRLSKLISKLLDITIICTETIKGDTIDTEKTLIVIGNKFDIEICQHLFTYYQTVLLKLMAYERRRGRLHSRKDLAEKKRWIQGCFIDILSRLLVKKNASFNLGLTIHKKDKIKEYIKYNIKYRL
jgi:hypothetical protein